MEKKLKLYLIPAACENMGIGHKGNLPWDLPKEFAHFDRMTTNVNETNPRQRNVVLMGRKTWEAFPENYRPLKDRVNIVISRNCVNWPPGVLSYTSWEEALNDLKTSSQYDNIGKIWICGGSDIYQRAMESSECHRIYLTRIKKHFDCDAFFPQVDTSKFQLVTDSTLPAEEQEEQGIQYNFQVFQKIPAAEKWTGGNQCIPQYKKLSFGSFTETIH